MRCLYLTCISLSLVLFLGNHVHARIGETYEESVKRYEKAGFTKERTTTTIPPDDKELGYCVMKTSQSKSVLNRQGVTELTWTNGGPVARQTVGVVLIKHIFLVNGHLPAAQSHGKMYCIVSKLHINSEMLQTPSQLILKLG